MFHLKKFLTYYGPYIKEIDPAINLGVYENKYPLHSRMMHYFTPPVQSTLSIIFGRTITGKMETIRLAREFFPSISVFDEILDTIDKHYEIPSLCSESGLTGLEDRLYHTLQSVKDAMAQHITIIPEQHKNDIRLWKKDIADIPVAPQSVIFDSSRFCRLMKGRLIFYANVPDHFDNIWLIQNELKRIGSMFYKTPFKYSITVLHFVSFYSIL